MQFQVIPRFQQIWRYLRTHKVAVSLLSLALTTSGLLAAAIVQNNMAPPIVNFFLIIWNAPATSVERDELQAKLKSAIADKEKSEKKFLELSNSLPAQISSAVAEAEVDFRAKFLPDYEYFVAPFLGNDDCSSSIKQWADDNDFALSSYSESASDYYYIKYEGNKYLVGCISSTGSFVTIVVIGHIKGDDTEKFTRVLKRIFADRYSVWLNDKSKLPREWRYVDYSTRLYLRFNTFSNTEYSKQTDEKWLQPDALAYLKKRGGELFHCKNLENDDHIGSYKRCSVSFPGLDLLFFSIDENNIYEETNIRINYIILAASGYIEDRLVWSDAEVSDLIDHIPHFGEPE